MTRIYKLFNQIKHYEWGSHDMLPRFLNIKNGKNLPYAELWMGTHSNGLSQAQQVYPELKPLKISLLDVCGELPFLFKMLAVEKPLSIQAHPDKEQAAEGFMLEENAKLELNAPRRNYKDPNHKPEILCALSPFTLMAGFRTLAEIQSSLEELILLLPQLKEILTTLLRALNTGSLAVFLRMLFNFSELERDYLIGLIREKGISQDGKAISMRQWRLMKSLSNQYPDDPAILSPIYLNLFSLEAGQAVFIPAGILHSYISGFGVELMAPSDNVLRGGLTPKFIDVPELMNIVNFNSYMPEILTPDSPSWFCYPQPCNEFSLAIMRGSGGENKFPEKGPAICIVTEGELVTGNIIFKKGDSFFISPGGEPVSFSGDFSLFAAFSGENSNFK